MATLADARQSFLVDLELAGKSPLTLEAYGRHLEEFGDWLGKPLDVADIESSHVKRFLLHLNRRPRLPGYQHHTTPNGGLAPETIRHYFWTLRSFFGWAREEGLLNGHRPMHGVPKPPRDIKERRILCSAEVRRFLGLLDKPDVKKRTLFVAFYLMARLGLRISEVCDLGLSDLDLEAALVYVKGKGRRERTLPVPRDLAHVLQAYVSEVRPRFANGSGTLLVSYTGQPLLPSSLRKSFARYARRAGLPATATPHTLRHSMATQFVRDGGGLYTLQHILGHSDIKTTEVYLHTASTRDMAAALDKMDWV
jgi:integrase/recombinase XerD